MTFLAHYLSHGLLPMENQLSKPKIEIQPRNVEIDFSDIKTPYFYNKNPCISAMWVGLSTSFPQGEVEFIRSTRAFESQITDQKLLDDVAKFAHQEAHHALQHRQINRKFQSVGYEVEKLEQFLKHATAQRAAKSSPEKRLARTVVLEHVTAVMAHYALAQEQKMAPFPESLRALFQWHAIEEIEHKSVAFDVYQHCVADRGMLMRQYYRFVFFEFPLGIFMGTRFLLKQMGCKVTWAHRRELWHYLFNESGLISSVKSLYWMFRKPGFHPWDQDDSDLINAWKRRLAPYFLT